MIKAGTRRLVRRYIGTREVVRVYQGSHLVWERGAPASPYLTFSSPNSFTLATKTGSKYWDGILEYSGNALTWSEWDGTTTLQSTESNGLHSLYLRGTGNTVITDYTEYGTWIISGSNVNCNGNIETLLDHSTVSSGLHPIMGEGCFSFLFDRCDALVSPPSLSSTAIRGQCYYAMFRRCINLESLPELPASELTPDYGGIAPETDAYVNMFRGCAKIKLSETQTGEYQTPYRIPPNGTASYHYATPPTDFMFTGTGGTFVGTPDVNTTYYTSNTVIPAI